MLIQGVVGDSILVMRQFYVYILASKSHRLYVGVTNNMQAIRREKAIKHLSRADKITLIERRNPHWNDLSDRWFDRLLPADPRDIDY